MINVSRVINDLRISQSFTVYRKSGHYQGGRWISNDDQPINMYGVISVAKAEDLTQVPEGDRSGGAIVIYATKEIFTTHSDIKGKGTSDEILWHGDRYRVYEVEPYIDYGYYKAVGIRMISK